MQDVTDLTSWIGKKQIRTETIGERQAELLSVTLDVPCPVSGDELPLPWHWAWFNDAVPASGLGRDGHPQRGGFIPPVALPRRMWAGGELERFAPIRIGAEITKTSTVQDIREKSGKSGPLCIVTLCHEFHEGETLCIRELQNLVYREDPQAGAEQPVAPAPPVDPQIKREFTPDPVLMFRYSALTFNGHRIHYDVDYARDVEGYPGLVFHAPLTATFLFAIASELAGGAVNLFSYRATSPLFCGEPIKLCGKHEDDGIVVWAENAQGRQAMIAKASVRDGSLNAT